MSTVLITIATLVLATGGFGGVWVGYLVWQRRGHPAAEPLAKISTLPGIAGLCRLVFVFVHGPAIARAPLGAINFIVYIAPGCFLPFALAYTGRADWLDGWKRTRFSGTFR